MKGEINRDWYCAGAHVDNNGKVDYCGYRGGEIHFSVCKKCKHCHRKHPTPEQFKEEYGEEWDGAVYFFYIDTKRYACATSFEAIKELAANEECIPVVCACTPWGRPPADWRSE